MRQSKLHEPLVVSLRTDRTHAAPWMLALTVPNCTRLNMLKNSGAELNGSPSVLVDGDVLED